MSWQLSSDDYRRVEACLISLKLVSKEQVTRKNFCFWPRIISWATHNACQKNASKDWRNFLLHCKQIVPQYFESLSIQRPCFICGEIADLHITFPCGHATKCKRCCNASHDCTVCWEKSILSYCI